TGSANVAAACAGASASAPREQAATGTTSSTAAATTSARRDAGVRKGARARRSVRTRRDSAGRGRFTLRRANLGPFDGGPQKRPRRTRRQCRPARRRPGTAHGPTGPLPVDHDGTWDRIAKVQVIGLAPLRGPTVAGQR